MIDINAENFILTNNKIKILEVESDKINKIDTFDSKENLYLDENLNKNPVSKPTNNLIYEIKCFKYLQNISILEAKNLNIFSLHKGVYLNLPNLNILDLRENKLVSISEDIVMLKYLKVLKLDNNSITNLPKNIYNMISIETLSFSNNNITFIEPNIKKLKNLRRLNFSHNQIIHFPNEISLIENLESLNVESNYFESIPTSLYKLNLKSFCLEWFEFLRFELRKNLTNEVFKNKYQNILEKYKYSSENFGTRITEVNDPYLNTESVANENEKQCKMESNKTNNDFFDYCNVLKSFLTFLRKCYKKGLTNIDLLTFVSCFVVSLDETKSINIKYDFKYIDNFILSKSKKEKYEINSQNSDVSIETTRAIYLAEEKNIKQSKIMDNNLIFKELNSKFYEFTKEKNYITDNTSNVNIIKNFSLIQSEHDVLEENRNNLIYNQNMNENDLSNFEKINKKLRMNKAKSLSLGMIKKEFFKNKYNDSRYNNDQFMASNTNKLKLNLIFKAIENNYVGVMKQYLRYDIECLDERNNMNRSPLFVAISLNNKIMLDLIMKNYSLKKVKNTGLYLYKAIKMGNPFLVEYLLKNNVLTYGCDEKGSNAYHILFYCFNKKSPEYLIIGNILAEYKVKKNYFNNDLWAPIHVASRKGGSHCLLWIIRENNKEKKKKIKNVFDLNIKGKNGWTPLHLCACSNKFLECLILLSSGSISIVRTDDGRSIKNTSNGNYLMTKLIRLYEKMHYNILTEEYFHQSKKIYENNNLLVNENFKKIDNSNKNNAQNLRKEYSVNNNDKRVYRTINENIFGKIKMSRTPKVGPNITYNTNINNVYINFKEQKSMRNLNNCNIITKEEISKDLINASNNLNILQNIGINNYDDCSILENIKSKINTNSNSNITSNVCNSPEKNEKNVIKNDIIMKKCDSDTNSLRVKKSDIMITLDTIENMEKNDVLKPEITENENTKMTKLSLNLNNILSNDKLFEIKVEKKVSYRNNSELEKSENSENSNNTSINKFSNNLKENNELEESQEDSVISTHRNNKDFKCNYEEKNVKYKDNKYCINKIFKHQITNKIKQVEFLTTLDNENVKPFFIRDFYSTFNKNFIIKFENVKNENKLISKPKTEILSILQSDYQRNKNENSIQKIKYFINDFKLKHYKIENFNNLFISLYQGIKIDVPSHIFLIKLMSSKGFVNYKKNEFEIIIANLINTFSMDNFQSIVFINEMVNIITFNCLFDLGNILKKKLASFIKNKEFKPSLVEISCIKEIINSLYLLSFQKRNSENIYNYNEKLNEFSKNLFPLSTNNRLNSNNDIVFNNENDNLFKQNLLMRNDFENDTYFKRNVMARSFNSNSAYNFFNKLKINEDKLAKENNPFKQNPSNSIKFDNFDKLNVGKIKNKDNLNYEYYPKATITKLSELSKINKHKTNSISDYFVQNKNNESSTPKDFTSSNLINTNTNDEGYDTEKYNDRENSVNIINMIYKDK